MSDITVTFKQTGKTAIWDDACENLLEFAQRQGVEIESGCVYGDCGTCYTGLSKGNVSYIHETGQTPEEGTCLPCSCVPDGDITLDA